jgi:hypothetical protein
VYRPTIPRDIASAGAMLAVAELRTQEFSRSGRQESSILHRRAALHAAANRGRVIVD